MGGISLAIGLTCVGMGLPMIAAESGFWDLLGVILLTGGVVLTLLGLIWRKSDRPSTSSATASGSGASTISGSAIANPQAGRDLHLGDTYNLLPCPEDGVSLSRAVANALTELDAIRLRLLEARKTGRLAILPADHHQPLADLMADNGWVDSRRILDDAYNACDSLQHRLMAPHRRWESGPYPELVEPTIQEEDDLPAVLEQVEEAIAELRQLQKRSPD